MTHPTRTRRCTVDDCEGYCIPPSRFCPAHRLRFLRHGDTSGRTIRLRELKPFNDLAERLLCTYASRPDTAAAVQWCERLLTARLDERTTRELARLRRGGVTGADVLCAGLAQWAYAERFPASLPDDVRLTYALGRAVVRLRRQPSVFTRGSLTKRYSRYVPGAVFRELGMILREALCLFFTRLLRLHERDREADADLRRAIREGAPDDPRNILHPTREAR